MKKLIPYFSLFCLVLFLGSCKSSKNAQHSKCDAYSMNVKKQSNQSDLASVSVIEKKMIRPE